MLCMYSIAIVVRMRRVDYTVVCIVTSCISRDHPVVCRVCMLSSLKIYILVL